MKRLLFASFLMSIFVLASAQGPETISPSRSVPVGKAPAMKWKLVKNTPEEKVYAVTFYKGDEVLSGLTDFATEQHVANAHFTGIGAVNSATLAWLDLPQKIYHAIPVREQVEVLSLTGDIASYQNKPIIHMHAVVGRHDGQTMGGHVFELNANPTIEVFLTANAVSLTKRADEASGMKLIDPRP